MTVEERFEQLVDGFVGVDGVTPPAPGQGFGSSALKYRGRIFAMLVRGQLVVKLSRGRVTSLVEAGEGARFDANKGTPMKEWFALSEGSGMSWPGLADEALQHAGGRR
ncbi:hypothetical protein [Actinoplanes sp. NPDC051411]|uniref:hypothetical protein n=1 Tax=Actinoplanes sp. NPDC051411 TaxID=3155522 RepID=UPI00341F61D2